MFHLHRAPLFAVLAGCLCCPWIGAQASQCALRFYGTGQNQQDRVRIQIDDNGPGPNASAPCDLGAGNFTIEFWLRGKLASNNTTNGGGDVEYLNNNWLNGNVVIDRDIAGNSKRGWGASIAGGYVRFGTRRGDVLGDNDDTIEGNINVLDGPWHHVALTRDAASGSKRIYVDGQLDFQSTAGASNVDLSYPDGGVNGQAGPWSPYIVLAAEKYDAGPAYPAFNGWLDELRLWNVARTQKELLDTYDRVIPANTPGLAGYYRFEAGAGTAVADSSAAGSPTGQLIAGVPGNGEWAPAAVDPINTAPVSSGMLPSGFQKTTLTTALGEPTVLEFLPDGRLLIGERAGRIWIWQNGVLLSPPLIQLGTNITNGERGLVGLARDPAFPSNGYIYCHYTTHEPRNRVSRLTVVGNVASPASEVLVWQNPALAADYHHGGCIQFGPDGDLYISTGDQLDSGNSQTLSNQHGKLLRVTPTGGIPSDNPFLGTPGAQAPIWAWGLRNPFRFVFDGLDGKLWMGDVGGNIPEAWEELELGVAGANYGWPDQEGPSCYVSSCAGQAASIWSYQHDDPAYFNTIPQACVIVGPVYHATAFPPAFRDCLYFGDYANRWIRRLVFDGSGQPVGDPLFLLPQNAGTIVDLEVGLDGALYYVTNSVPWSGNPDSPGLHRIAYVGGGNQQPTVVASATPAQGAPPLSVQFSSSGTLDPDNGPAPLSFAWTFGDGGSSTLANPTHGYAGAGQYSVVLSASDGALQASSAPVLVTVGNAPVPSIAAPAADTTYKAGQQIAFSGAATDVEDGVLGPSGLTWQVVFVHLDHAHPHYGPVTGTSSGSFTIPLSGHPPESTHYQIQLTAVDSNGLAASATRDIYPVLSTLALDTIPSGIPIFLDGEAHGTPNIVQSLEGFQHLIQAQTSYSLAGQNHQYACWSDGGAQTHMVVAPPGGTNLTAIYETGGGGGCSGACGFTSYGLAASSANVLGLVGTGAPKLAGAVQILTTNLGAAPGAWTFCALSSASFALFGGVGLVNALQPVVLVFRPAVGGQASWQLPVPGDPSIVGLTLYFQSAALSAIQPQGLAFSAGLSVEICP